jgi:hypothetical protein
MINLYQDKKLVDKTGLSKKDIIFVNDKLNYIDKEQYTKEYIDFIGKLNEELGSIWWWAGSISSKNQYVSSLYKNICRFIELVKTIENARGKEVHVIVENHYLIMQLKEYFRHKGISINIFGRAKKLSILKSKKNISINLISLLRKLIERSRIHRILGNELSGKLKQKSNKYVIRTWLDSRSFDGGEYKDPFFGRLPFHIKNRYEPVILGTILSSFDENLMKIKEYNAQNSLPIIPQTYFNKAMDYFKIYFLQWAAYIKLNGQLNARSKIEFKGFDISWLIKEELINNLMSGEFRDNLLAYMSANHMSKSLNPKFFTLPYENHSWEKLTFVALRKTSTGTRIIGYQHSSMSKRLFNYFLSRNESSSVPLPDKIITCGKIPTEILHQDGNFPKKLLREGCALRYEYLFDSKPKTRKRTRNILMAFPIGLNESVELLKFLVDAFKAKPEYKIQLKPHPSSSMNNVLSESKIKLPEDFVIVEDRNMLDLFSESDILLYSETTVCIEALMVGIPVVYIDIDDYYNKDRLFKCEHFKWTVKTEAGLVKALKEIYEMNQKEFEKQQNLARDYIKNYFYRVNENRMDLFIEK